MLAPIPCGEGELPAIPALRGVHAPGGVFVRSCLMDYGPQGLVSRVGVAPARMM